MSRLAGYHHTPEVKERIGKGVSHTRHASSIQTQEYYRSKIKTTQILNALGRIAAGEVEGKPNQVAAATVLLRKVLPDLQSVELRGNGATTTVIITGVVRHEDLVASPSLPNTIDHVPSDCNTSASSSASPATPTEGQTSSASLIEKREGGGGE